jgi:predicted nucleic acid-binding protein
MKTEQAMDIVIDTSVIIAVISNEPQRGILIELTRGAQLLAPGSVYWEVGNAFSAMMKRNRIGLEQALRAIAAYDQIPIRFVDVDLHDTLAIAAQLGLYAYDAYLIRCALRYDAPLLSLDRGLILAAQQAGAKVLEVK